MAAGDVVTAGKVSGERVATTIRTATSAGVTTTETVIDTVVAPVVVGRIYKVTWDSKPNSTVAGDDIQLIIREDSLTGTVLQLIAIDIAVINRYGKETLEVEYTADATEDKTFVLTIQRIAGTGSVTTVAGTTQPTYFYVDYIRG